MLSTFHVLTGHSYIFFGEVSIQDFCPFFLGFCFSTWISGISLYSLHASPFLDGCVVNIITLSAACFFIFIFIDIMSRSFTVGGMRTIYFLFYLMLLLISTSSFAYAKVMKIFYVFFWKCYCYTFYS